MGMQAVGGGGSNSVVSIRGTLCDPLGCVCQALALDARNAAAWQQLADCLKTAGGRTVCVGSVRYDYWACLTMTQMAELYHRKKHTVHGLLLSCTCEGLLKMVEKKKERKVESGKWI